MGEQTTPAGRPAVRIPAELPQPDTWTPVTWDTEDSAGPASSSASPGGTGGLADLLARLQAEVQSLAGMARAAADVVEGQRRELWDAVVHSARCAEHPGGLPGKDFSRTASTLQYAYRVIAGLDGPELERLLAAELDSRYGKDRAKGGGPS
jgi:hypothetical protein